MNGLTLQDLEQLKLPELPLQETVEKLANLSGPIDKLIKECETDNDLLMLSCLMLERAKEIMDIQMSEEGRKIIFREYI